MARRQQVVERLADDDLAALGVVLRYLFDGVGSRSIKAAADVVEFAMVSADADSDLAALLDLVLDGQQRGQEGAGATDVG